MEHKLQSISPGHSLEPGGRAVLWISLQERMMGADFWDTIAALLGKSWSSRNDEKYWSGWLEGGLTGRLTVTEVQLEANGLYLKAKDAGDGEHELKAVPTGPTSCDVSYQDELAPDAALVFDLRPSPGNLDRCAFDFRPIQIHGKNVRFNFRYDP